MTIIDNLSQSEGKKNSEVQIMPKAYRNPTEDAAIGNIMREERRKKKSRERRRENRHLKNNKKQREVQHDKSV